MIHPFFIRFTHDIIYDILRIISFLRPKSRNLPRKRSQGNEIAAELPGGTVIVDPDIKYSLNSFTKDEQKRVRTSLLNKRNPDGTKSFTPAEVDQYLKDATSLASVIAADKARLDFEADENQVFLKQNQDYYFTLDASTQKGNKAILPFLVIIT